MGDIGIIEESSPYVRVVHGERQEKQRRTGAYQVKDPDSDSTGFLRIRHLTVMIFMKISTVK